MGIAPPPPPVPKPQGKGAKVTRVIIGILLLALVFICYGGVALMLSQTFVAWWIPTLIAVSLAALCALPPYRLWNWLTGIKSRWVHWACSLVADTALFMCALLFVNMQGATSQDTDYSKATVSERVQKTKHHTRRVGRRTYTTGSVYYVYEVTLRLDDGRQTTVSVPTDLYRHLRTGDTVRVKVATGTLGWDVMDTRDIRYKSHHKKKSKRHNPPVYRHHVAD